MHLQENKQAIYTHEENFLDKKAIDAVYEAYLAKKLLEDGLTRNAAGKAFQAWKDLLSCLIYLNLDKLAKDEKEREWYIKSGVYVPTSKMAKLTQRLEEIGVKGVSFVTDKALKLHTYQYNGPDPDGVWNGPRDEEEAKEDIKLLLKAFKEYFGKYVMPKVSEEAKRTIKEVIVV
jgi:hypothetical protein